MRRGLCTSEVRALDSSSVYMAFFHMLNSQGRVLFVLSLSRSNYKPTTPITILSFMSAPASSQGYHDTLFEYRKAPAWLSLSMKEVPVLYSKSVFRTIQSFRLGGRTERTTSGSPSFFKSIDGLRKIEVGRDALQGPVGPYGVFLLVFFRLYTHKILLNVFISRMLYDLGNNV